MRATQRESETDTARRRMGLFVRNITWGDYENDPPQMARIRMFQKKRCEIMSEAEGGGGFRHYEDSAKDRPVWDLGVGKEQFYVAGIDRKDKEEVICLGDGK